MQRLALRIQRQQTARHHGHCPGGLFQLAKRLAQCHRLPGDIGLGMRRVGPPADVRFIDEQPVRGIVDLTKLGVGRQRQIAHQARLAVEPVVRTNQPLLALALFAHQEHKQVAGIIAVQTQAGH